MKTNLTYTDIKHALAILPLLAGAALPAAAGPVMLGGSDMDSITAGTQKILERVADLLAATPGAAFGIQAEDMLVLAADQSALLHKIASGELVAFQRLPTGELIAAQQPQPGQKIVLVQQAAPDAAPASALSAGGNVTTYLLKPGEALNIRQTSSGGTNYLYIRSTGASSVTTAQQIVR